MIEPFIPDNDHETPEETELPFLRLAKQLGSQRIPQKKRAQHGNDLPGRPFAVATIPQDWWAIEQARFRYSEIIHGLTYQEAMALMRALDRTWSTFLMRKYGHREPSLEEIILTIQWFDSGKPIQITKHHLKIASLF